MIISVFAYVKGFLGPKCTTGLHSPSPSPSGFSTLNSRHRTRHHHHHHHHPRLNRAGKADSNSTSCHDTGNMKHSHDIQSFRVK